MKPIVIAQLNDRAQPLDRGDLYEDPLDWVLKESGRGQVTGGGTQLGANGEVAFCEVEIELEEVTEDAFAFLKLVFARLGAPRGSNPGMRKAERERCHAGVPDPHQGL